MRPINRSKSFVALLFGVGLAGAAALVGASLAGAADRVALCHANGNGTYRHIVVSVNAEPAHSAHGDAAPGAPVPGLSGQIFSEQCVPIAACAVEGEACGSHADCCSGTCLFSDDKSGGGSVCIP